MATHFKPAQNFAIDDLLLDSLNPRIPLEKRSLPPDDLTRFVAERYNAIAIAKSIAAHEYFPSEPLIAIAKGGTGKFIVVEGNRRLSALKLLKDERLRERLEDRAEWDEIDSKSVPNAVPVIVAAKREDVAPIIGYRHISGIQPWDAHAKARYIASQIQEGRTVEETAKDVGETQSEVRASYRNYGIGEQAREEVGEETFNNLTERFGVFTRAMQSAELREFIGAPTANGVKVGKKQIPPKKTSELKEFIGYLFGPEPIVTDSRDLTKLGKAVASAEGLEALRAGQSLEEAHNAAGGVLDRLVNRLSNAAYSGDCDRLFRSKVTAHSGGSALGGFLTPIGHVASTIPSFPGSSIDRVSRGNP
jgi:hypothetical protein